MIEEFGVWSLEFALGSINSPFEGGQGDVFVVM
jgi:hypothetical protein